MNERRAKQVLARNVVIFVVLVIGGLIVMLGARTWEDSFEQAVLLHTGAAIFGADLTFFFLEMMAWERRFGNHA